MPVQRWAKSILVLLALAALALTGCAIRRFIVEGKSFFSSSEALHYQAEYYASLKKEIAKPACTSVGPAQVLVPSDGVLLAEFLKTPHNADTNREQVTWVLSARRMQNRFVADVIADAGIFRSSSVQEYTDDPARYSMGENDWLVYLDVGGWYVRQRSGGVPVKVRFDRKGGPPAVLKDLLEQLCRAVSGSAPGTPGS